VEEEERASAREDEDEDEDEGNQMFAISYIACTRVQFNMLSRL